MMTLRKAQQELNNEPDGSVLLEDNAGDMWLPRNLLTELESDDEGRFELARTVMQVDRTEHELDSVIAYVSPDGYEYPNEPQWYVIRPSAPR